LTEAIEEGRVLGRDRDPRQISFKSERGKFFGGMRKQMMPTPIGLMSAADSNIRQGIPAACSASPRVNPPMPAPTIMMSSMSAPGALGQAIAGMKHD